MLTIRPVSNDHTTSFVAYCHRYGPEHDESYLPEADFVLQADQPSFLLHQGGQLVGAVSLLCQPRFRQVGKGRFAILHSSLSTKEAYGQLLDAVRPHFTGLRSVYLFLPQNLTATADILVHLGFEIERYSYVLVHDGDDIPPPEFPPGMKVLPIEANDLKRLELFADLINQNFGHLAGHTQATVETILEMFSDPGYFKGGIGLLMDGDRAIGTLAVMREYDDPQAAEVMAFSLAEDYRGHGLGRELLRAAMHVGLQADLKPIFLSVNAENEGAVRLYRSEGFEPQETMVCYALQCGPD